MGDSDSVEVGEQVVAIGNALGYGQSVTTGIISAANRVIDSDSSSDGSSDGTTADTSSTDTTGKTYLQTDAAINPPVAFTVSEVSLLSAAVVVVVVGIVTSCFCSVAVPITFVPTAAVPMKTPPATSPKHAAMASVMPHFFADDIGFFAFFL